MSIAMVHNKSPCQSVGYLDMDSPTPGTPTLWPVTGKDTTFLTGTLWRCSSHYTRTCRMHWFVVLTDHTSKLNLVSSTTLPSPISSLSSLFFPSLFPSSQPFPFCLPTLCNLSQSMMPNTKHARSGIPMGVLVNLCLSLGWVGRAGGKETRMTAML